MKTICSIVMIFMRKIWQLLNFIRNLIINVFLTFIILLGLNLYLSINHSIQDQKSKNNVLLLDINGTLVNKPSNISKIKTIWHRFLGSPIGHLQENSILDVVDMIRQAKLDHNIAGIILDLKNLIHADQPSMQYIGKALNEFRLSGKPVIAIGSSYNQEQYYLASFANKIWLSPYGKIDLHGFAINNLYYKNLLDFLKIHTYVFRIGAYKSAVEPLTQNYMSSAVRNETNRWINDLWKNYLKTIAHNRRISVNKIFPDSQKIINDLRNTGGDTAKYAVNNNLVDFVGYRDKIEEELSKIFCLNKINKSYQTISMYDYIVNKKIKNTNNKIAVIFINGIIKDTIKTPNNIDSDTTVLQIRNARLRSNVKAIVLCVNSPGGSLNSSEKIREELLATNRAGKPIVVLMGSLAASGGYWVSTAANYILANPSTITGSIGIFGIVNTIEDSLNCIGIHTDGVSTSPLADLTITKSLTPEILKIIQLSIKNGYDNFIKIVAQSRKKSTMEVNSLAQGKIWTGLDAKKNGLIDNLGDFDDAIKKAAELAKINAWNIDYSYPAKTNFFDTLVDGISNLITITLQEKFPQISPLVTNNSSIKESEKILGILNDPKNCYAICLTNINLK